MYNICMLRHSKIVMFLAYIIVYFFSLYICPCMECSKRKICKEHEKQKDQIALKKGCKHVSRRCGSYMMYLKVIVPLLWLCVKCIRSPHILNLHNMRNLCTLVMFSHITCILFANFDTCVGTMWFGHHKKYMC